MSNLQVSFSVVFPLFLSIALGYFLRVVKIWSEPTISKVNGLVFKVFLPVSVFLNVYRSDLNRAFNMKMVLFCCIGIFCMFLFFSLLVPLIEGEPRRRGVMVQGMMRSNYVILGIPVVESMFGSAGSSAAAAMITFVIPMYNVLSVITLEINRSRKPNVFKILLGILKNPLILASLLGVLCIIFKIQLPSLLVGTMDDWAGIATPLALVALGGSFEFSKIKSGFRQLFTVIFTRLIAVPAVMLTIAVLLGFRNVELMTLMAVFATPTAVSSYTMAQQQGGDGELAGQIVVFTSLLSMFTLFGIIFLLRTFALI